MEEGHHGEVPGANAEGDVAGIHVDVVLPNGRVKQNAWLNSEITVRQEKERLLNEARIPSASNYVMVKCNREDNSSRVMEDHRDMDEYVHDLSDNSQIEIRPSNSANLERAGKPVRFDPLNVDLRK